jgi:hypothetical protein
MSATGIPPEVSELVEMLWHKSCAEATPEPFLDAMMMQRGAMERAVTAERARCVGIVLGFAPSDKSVSFAMLAQIADAIRLTTPPSAR